MSFTGLAECTVGNRAQSIERKVWSTSIGEGATTALLFLDAELFVQRVLALDVLQQAYEQSTLPSVVAAFVSNQSSAARHVDYVCNDDYAAFIAEDVVAWLRQQRPAIREVVIVGLSLSGLAAAHLATRYPHVFHAAICQSPSFWWEQGRFAAELPTAANPAQQFWICVGNQETESGVSHAPSGLRQEWTQIAGCDFACTAMRAKGYNVQYHDYAGGHDPNCWREDLTLALAWLFSQR
jgi:enterochelin esterase-like enzyme